MIGVVLRHYWPPNRALAFPRGTIIVGIDASNPPFALDDGASLQGLDVDLSSAVAAEIGLPLRFVNIGYYGLYDALISGEVDLLVSALRIDPNRMEDVRYSLPYFGNGLVLVAPPASAIPDALGWPGKASPLNSPAAPTASSVPGMPGASNWNGCLMNRRNTPWIPCV